MTATTREVTFGTKITTGPSPWQVLQREADGKATVALEGIWKGEGMDGVEVRVTSEHSNTGVDGCNWQRAENLDGNAWRITLRIPTGGLYRIETRLYRENDLWRGNGAKIWHVAVGDLWVIAGQSNSSGCGGHGMVVDPPALGVSLYATNDEWRLATHPIFDNTDCHYPRSMDCGWVDVSPWLTFGKEILNDAHVPVGLIPAGLGGSPLRDWDPGNPDGAFLFDNMVNMIDAAGGRIAGMVWYQGCSDCGEDWGKTYLARFSNFVKELRARYGENLPVITAQLNRVVEPQDVPNRWWSVVREAQRQAARTIPNVGIVTTQDLTMSDIIHNSAVGNVTLGQRYACVALGMVYGKGTCWQAVDVRDIRFDDETRTKVRITFVHVVDHIEFMAGGKLIADFTVEDEAGTVPITAARVEKLSEVVLELERPAQGQAQCHNMHGHNPVNTLRDDLGRPVLAFYGVEIAG